METRQDAPEGCWEPQNVSVIGQVWCRCDWGVGGTGDPRGREVKTMEA